MSGHMDGHFLSGDSEQPRAVIMCSSPVQQLIAPVRRLRERRRPAQMGSDLTRLEYIGGDSKNGSQPASLFSAR